METAPYTTRFPRRASLWPLATAGLLAAGWATFLLAAGYASRLVEQSGPAPDVVDALGRDAYIRPHVLPYYSAALMLDVLAAVTLPVRSRPGWPRVLKLAAAVLLVPSVALHWLAWWIWSVF